MNPACCNFSDTFNICIKVFHSQELCRQLCHASDTEIIHEFLIPNNKLFAVQITISGAAMRKTDEE